MSAQKAKAEAERVLRRRLFFFFFSEDGTREILLSALAGILKNCLGDYYIQHIYGFCAMIYNFLYFR